MIKRKAHASITAWSALVLLTGLTAVSCLSAGGRGEVAEQSVSLTGRANLYYITPLNADDKGLAQAYYLNTQSAFYGWINFSRSGGDYNFTSSSEYRISGIEGSFHEVRGNYEIRGLSFRRTSSESRTSLRGRLIEIRFPLNSLLVGEKPIQPALYAVESAAKESGSESGRLRIIDMEYRSAVFLVKVLLQS